MKIWQRFTRRQTPATVPDREYQPMIQPDDGDAAMLAQLRGCRTWTEPFRPEVMSNG